MSIKICHGFAVLSAVFWLQNLRPVGRHAVCIFDITRKSATIDGHEKVSERGPISYLEKQNCTIALRRAQAG